MPKIPKPKPSNCFVVSDGIVIELTCLHNKPAARLVFFPDKLTLKSKMILRSIMDRKDTPPCQTK